MKIVAIFLVVLMACFSFAPAATAADGGIEGFIIGCCFGIRSAAAHNDGKDLHWREWIRLIPLADIVGMVFDAVDGMNGMTTSRLASQYGSNYY
ncbi:MAG: hypothetical protein IKO01_12645 [Kiritimatiellae bacterium]|nr:hypothetical protein [Kiritimatiellia bacterium]MBR4252996.1 hypothetical protein [Kiritimatiellia bacterium]